MDRFSQRHGYEPPEPEIRVRHEAPHDLRGVLADLAYESGLDPHGLRAVVCRTLRVRENPDNWSAYPNVDDEARGHLDTCQWYEVYDIIESIYSQLVGASARRQSVRAGERDIPRPEQFESELNAYFRKNGIGWQLAEGKIQVRGAEAFEQTISAARVELADGGRQTAANEIHQALADLSRRPDADVTGALQHGLAALECVIRDLSGDPKATLGVLLAKHRGIIPAPLDQAVEKIWGYASEQGRHLREGREPTLADAELAVQVAAAVAAYLSKRSRAE
jgi:hypothetical protein